MPKISLLVFLVTIVFTALAHADDWSKIYDLTSTPDLRIEAHDANVRIETWDQSRIEARLTTHGWHIGTGGLEILEHQMGNAVGIELRSPHRAHFSLVIENHRSELEIRMPRTAKVAVHSGDGDVIAKGLEGELDFTTGDGKLNLEDVDGSSHLHTSDGSARVSGRFRRSRTPHQRWPR
jgi:hypothetical protein